MCGIAGIWNFAGEPSAKVRLEAMLEAMQHRGPDGRGAMEYAGGAAGMVRLALVDLTTHGNQPMWSPCGRVAILFNGEIYNFREERRRLESAGHQFRSETDTEVLLALYLDLGLEFVKRLRGMYAAAVFDWRATESGGVPTVTLVRGPFGIKPLYIAEIGPQKGTLVFASELRSLLASELVERRIDQAALVDYLHFGFIVQPRSIIQNVRMLEAGTIEQFVPGKPPQKIRYWRMPTAEPRNESFEESAERLRSELDESIRLHTLADAPIGAFLSGGIDSTCIVSLMRKQVSDLRTYTLQFPEFPGSDEAAIAAETAKKLDCRHTTVPVTGADVATLLPQYAAELDQPSSDGLNNWLISRAASRDVKGVLSGLGGDEWFAGYPVVGRMAAAGASPFRGRVRSIAGWTAHQLSGLAPTASLARRFEGVASRRTLLATWLYAHTVFPLRQAYSLAQASFPADGWQAEGNDFKQLSGLDWERETPIGLGCLLDVYGYMMCQLLRDADAVSMASSLELRVPFVDVKIAAFSRSCRDDYKRTTLDNPMHRDYPKKVLVKAVEDVLPQGISRLPKKGFTLPIANWMKRDFQPLIAATCNPEAIQRRGLIDLNATKGLYTSRLSGLTYDRSPQLWSLMIFELWAQKVLDAPRRLQPSYTTV